MAHPVEFTDEFGEWWDDLTAAEQRSLDRSVMRLQEFGYNLKRPYVDAIRGSKFTNMRELRCQHEGRPYRLLFAFDPRRTAMLLIGGDKTGRPDWYEEFVPKADKIYAQHLKEIGEQEGKTVARNFNELREKLQVRLGPEQWAAHLAEVKADLTELRNMEELRQARSLTQTELAETLKVSQGAVSKVERRADMYISTLRSYVRAMGGDVQIRAIFPEGEVILNQFQDLDAESSPPAKRRAPGKRAASSQKLTPRRARIAAAGM